MAESSTNWAIVFGVIGFVIAIILLGLTIYLYVGYVLNRYAISGLRWRIIEGSNETSSETLAGISGNIFYIGNNTSTFTLSILADPAWQKGDSLIIKACGSTINLKLANGVKVTDCNPSTGNGSKSNTSIQAGDWGYFIFTNKNQMIRIN